MRVTLMVPAEDKSGLDMMSGDLVGIGSVGELEDLLLQPDRFILLDMTGGLIYISLRHVHSIEPLESLPEGDPR